MLRLAEIGMFLVPFALYAAWRLIAVKASAWLVAASVGVAVVAAAGTIWYGLDRSASPSSGYVPAHLEHGEIVPGGVRSNPP